MCRRFEPCLSRASKAVAQLVEQFLKTLVAVAFTLNPKQSRRMPELTTWLIGFKSRPQRCGYVTPSLVAILITNTFTLKWQRMPMELHGYYPFGRGFKSHRFHFTGP